jgi:short-subunit dehydrogenase
MKNKVVIITGASSGIGRSLALEAARSGARLVLAARNMANLSEVVDEIKQFNENVIACQTDVSKESDCQKLIETTVSKFGKIDILINNAGISMRAIFADADLKVIHRLMDVNFWGTVYCTKFALPYLLKSKGSVVGVSSTAGFMGLPGRTGYSASKFAMQGFLESLRIENIRNGLHVLIASPGFTASNIRNSALNGKGEQQGESPRDENSMMTSERVAKLIIRAIKIRRRNLVITFEGKFLRQIKWVVPGLIDKMIYRSMSREPDSPFH